MKANSVVHGWLQPPRIYLPWCIGFVASSYLGMACGVLLAEYNGPAFGPGPPEYLRMLLNPYEWVWVWLPCMVVSVVVGATMLALTRTVDQYSETAKGTTLRLLSAFFVVTFFISLATLSLIHI